MSQHTSSLWGGLFRTREPWYEEVTELWAKTPFFKGIPKREIRKLAKSMHLRKYNAGEYIFRSGDQGAGAAMIMGGHVEIHYEDTTLATLQRGDFFGEIALVLNERRTANAVATEPCELVFFLRQDLEEWMASAPQHSARLSTNLAHVLAKRLLHANQLLAEERKRRVG